MMKLFVVAGLLLVAMASFTMGPVNADGPLDQIQWELYKKSFGKVYGDAAEDAMRKGQFLDTKRRVEQHNAQLADKLGYEMGHSHLSDWTADELSNLVSSNTNTNRQKEFKSQFNMQEDELPQSIKDILNANLEDLPKEVDWRKVPNRVSSVKDQGKCVSSYAFVAAGVLEGQQVNVTSNNELIPLSVQNLIDCPHKIVSSVGNEHCKFGDTLFSMIDVAMEKGIMSEADYPYIDYNTGPHDGITHKCRFDQTKSMMKVKNGFTMPAREGLLQGFVALYGPVAALMYAPPTLTTYKSGVFSDPNCELQVNHNVLVVGYGTDTKQGDHWIVKNTWGADWGEQGYFRLARNKNDMCGIAFDANIAII